MEGYFTYYNTFTCIYTAKYENYIPKSHKNKGHFQDTMLI